jgi:hypothetical protein
MHFSLLLFPEMMKYFKVYEYLTIKNILLLKCIKILKTFAINSDMIKILKKCKITYELNQIEKSSC